MSFAKDTKLQILALPPENKNCEIAFMSGLLNVSGEFNLDEKSVSFLTDIPKLYDYANNIISRLYGKEVKLEIADDIRINKTKYFKVCLPKDFAMQMLKDFGILGSENEFLAGKINDDLLKDDESKKAYIKGVFLGCGTSSIKLSKVKTESGSTGYNVEFVSRSHNFLMELSLVLAEFGIITRLIQRKKHFVLYVKESNLISDLLALMGAYDSVLKLQDELALRELRNKINRQTNCLSANITKTVNASLKQVEAIQIISDTIGLESLPMELQEVALLRLANPEESLSELMGLTTEKLSKSALNHRLMKIQKIANGLK